MTRWGRWLQATPNTTALSLFAALSLAAALALTAPAQLAAWQLQKRSDRVLLLGVSGTVWNGASEAAFVRVQERWHALENLRWTWLAGHALTGGLGVQLHFAHRGGQVQATLRLGLDGSLLAKPARIDGLPVQYLKALLPLPIDLQGELALGIDELRWQAGALRAIDASVNWRDAGVSVGTTDYALGTLSAALSMPEPGSLLATLSDGGGPLELNGQLSHAKDRLQFDATLKARPIISTELRRALSLIGKPLANDDGWTLTFSGVFKLPGLSEPPPAATENAAATPSADGSG